MDAHALPERLVVALGTGLPAVIVTVGPDGWGHAAMTWAVAIAPDRVRFAVDHGSRSLGNLERDGKAALQVIGAENVLVLIKGRGRSCRPRIESAPFAMALWELSVTEVRDQSWGPVTVSPLTYEWTGPEAASMRVVEQAVLAELRDWRT